MGGVFSAHSVLHHQVPQSQRTDDEQPRANPAFELLIIAQDRFMHF